MKELKIILNMKKGVFLSGTYKEKKKINREVKRAIKNAKSNYKIRLRVCLCKVILKLNGKELRVWVKLVHWY